MVGLHRDVDYRQVVTDLPDKPVALPYELRTEMTWIDFSHPVNPLGCPRAIVQAMHTALVDGEIAFSPDRDGHALRDAIAGRLGMATDRILTGTSPFELIRAAAQVFMPGMVGIMSPCPPEYALAIENAGHRYVCLFNTRSFATVDAYTARDEAGQLDGAVLANPAYPTSRLLSSATLIHYLETCSWVIVDESNIELSFGGESVLPLVEEYPNLVVIRTPSVTYGMPGVPIAYLAAHPRTVRRIRALYDGGSISMFSEVLAKTLVAQGAYIDETHEFLDKEIPWMQCMLSLVPGISIYPAEGNFVLCEFSLADGMRLGVSCAEELIIRLQLAGFLVRPLKGTPGLASDEFFCVSVKLRNENQRLIDAMRSILNG
ncbi:pyridoxal phosphate-dependent aminotransferase [Cryptobacterium curtum]